MTWPHCIDTLIDTFHLSFAVLSLPKTLEVFQMKKASEGISRAEQCRSCGPYVAWVPWTMKRIRSCCSVAPVHSACLFGKLKGYRTVAGCSTYRWTAPINASYTQLPGLSMQWVKIYVVSGRIAAWTNKQGAALNLGWVVKAFSTYRGSASINTMIRPLRRIHGILQDQAMLKLSKTNSSVNNDIFKKQTFMRLLFQECIFGRCARSFGNHVPSWYSKCMAVCKHPVWTSCAVFIDVTNMKLIKTVAAWRGLKTMALLCSRCSQGI